MSGKAGSFFLIGATEGDQSPSIFKPAVSKKSSSVYLGPLSGWALAYL